MKKALAVGLWAAVGFLLVGCGGGGGDDAPEGPPIGVPPIVSPTPTPQEPPAEAVLRGGVLAFVAQQNEAGEITGNTLEPIEDSLQGSSFTITVLSDINQDGEFGPDIDISAAVDTALADLGPGEFEIDTTAALAILNNDPRLSLQSFLSEQIVLNVTLPAPAASAGIINKATGVSAVSTLIDVVDLTQQLQLSRASSYIVERIQERARRARIADGPAGLANYLAALDITALSVPRLTLQQEIINFPAVFDNGDAGLFADRVRETDFFEIVEAEIEEEAPTPVTPTAPPSTPPPSPPPTPTPAPVTPTPAPATPTPAPAAPSVVGTVDLSKTLIDRAERATVSGGFLYVSDVAGLKIFDISTPGTPVAVGSLPAPNITAIQIVGNTAYLLAAPQGRGGLTIVDVSNPLAPELLGFLDSTTFSAFSYSFNPSALAVSGSRAYVIKDSSAISREVAIIDVSDPALPANVGQFEVSIFSIDTVTAIGNTVYVAGSEGLQTIDVSDPTAPVVGETVASTESGLGAQLIINGGFLYLAAADHFRVFDISSPNTPVEIGSLPLPTFFNGSGTVRPFSVNGSKAYVAINSRDGTTSLPTRMLVIDISDPTNPTTAGVEEALSAGVGFRDLGASADRVFIADRPAGLLIIDTSTPSTPVLTSRVSAVSTPTRILASNGLAYVATNNAGVQIVDVNTPTDPRIISNIFLPNAGLVGDITLSGSLLFVTSQNFDGVYVADVSDPVNPQILGRAENNSRSSFSLAVDGNLAFVGQTPFGFAEEQARLRVVDVSSPTTPFFIGDSVAGGTEMPGITPNAGTLIASAGLLYAAVDGGFSPSAFNILDYGNPSAPSLVSTLEIAGLPTGLAIEGIKAYVSNSSGMEVIDISIPTVPANLGSFSVSSFDGGTRGIAVSETLAYLVTSRGGLLILDVTNPESINEAAQLQIDEGAPSPDGIALAGELAFIAGLDIFREQGLVYIVNLGAFAPTN